LLRFYFHGLLGSLLQLCGNIDTLTDTVAYAFLALGIFVLVVGPTILEVVVDATCLRDRPSCRFLDAEIEQRLLSEAVAPIVYSPLYNITAFGLENMHPFDSEKYGRIFQTLVKRSVITAQQTVLPRMPTRDDLLAVHTPAYLAKLHSSCYITRVVEVPVCCLPSYTLRKRLLEPMKLACGGTILAARIACCSPKKFCINLSGGYHHACANAGSGFCAYSDISLAITHIRRDFPDRFKKFMIVDLDAHQGNGHERDFLGDPAVYILDMFNPFIFPGDEVAKKAISRPVHMYGNHSDTEYLDLLRQNLSESLQEFTPDLIVFNAGTDCMAGDPLGGMNLSPAGIVARDQIVFDEALSRDIPLVMVLSGGYQPSTYKAIAASLINLNQKYPFVSGTVLAEAGRGSGMSHGRDDAKEEQHFKLLDEM
jgi:histone deacetylase 11